MEVPVQTVQLVTVTSSQVNQQVPITAPLPLLLKELRIASTGSVFQASLWSRAWQGALLRVRSIAPLSEPGPSPLVVMLEHEHDIRPGDTLVISGTSHGPYNASHPVIEVYSPTSVRLATTGTQSSFGGQAYYSVPAHYRSVYSLLDSSPSAGNVLVAGFDLPVVGLDIKRSTPEKRLYVVFSAADSYLVSLRGLIAHY